MPDLSEFVTTEEAAKMLQFHVEHVRRMLREGNLQGIRMGRTWLVLKKSVLGYMEATEGLNKFDPRRAPTK